MDEERRVVVGATITGAEIAEALHAATIAVVAEVSLDDLWHAVPSFPTRSELWLRLLGGARALAVSLGGLFIRVSLDACCCEAQATREARMNLHRNARLTPRGRRLLVERVCRQQRAAQRGG